MLYQQAIPKIVLSSAEMLEFESLSRNVLMSVGQLQEEHQRLSMRVSSCVGGAMISLGCLPEKLNPVIRPLMDCLKMEQDTVMQVGVPLEFLLLTPVIPLPTPSQNEPPTMYTTAVL